MCYVIGRSVIFSIFTYAYHLFKIYGSITPNKQYWAVCVALVGIRREAREHLAYQLYQLNHQLGDMWPDH